MALAVHQLPLPPLGTNCFIVQREGAPDAAVIDPGGDADQVRAALDRAGATCAGILITHTHWDHIGAVADLAEATGAPVYMPAAEADALAHPTEDARRQGVRPYQAEVLLEGDETVEVAGISFETLVVPGHSRGHLAYYADGYLFSGDVLFAGSVGRTDLADGDWDTLVDSIRTLLDRLPADTIVCPGHGPATTLGEEHARNPFLAELRA
jgi:hydroxyacylglutathione hydrolase